MEDRILGIDFGKKYVGVAVSDPLFITAQGLLVIERKNPAKLRTTLAKIDELSKEYRAKSIVIGLPKNLDGTENERCQFTYEFADMLYKRVQIPIYLWDERLTTVSSDKELEFLGKKERAKKKEFSDEMAAMMILQGFMDSVSFGTKHTPYLG